MCSLNQTALNIAKANPKQGPNYRIYVFPCKFSSSTNYLDNLFGNKKY